MKSESVQSGVFRQVWGGGLCCSLMLRCKVKLYLFDWVQSKSYLVDLISHRWTPIKVKETSKKIIKRNGRPQRSHVTAKLLNACWVFGRCRVILGCTDARLSRKCDLFFNFPFTSYNATNCAKHF